MKKNLTYSEMGKRKKMWCLSLLRISHNNSMNNFLPDMIISVTEVIVPSSTKSLCSLTPETNHWSRVVDSILESAASFPAFQFYSIPSFLLNIQLMYHTNPQHTKCSRVLNSMTIRREHRETMCQAGYQIMERGSLMRLASLKKRQVFPVGKMDYR